MTSMREDARRVLGARRERAAAAPAPVAVPLLTTAVLLALGVVLLVLGGFSLMTVVAAVLIIGLVGALAAWRTTLSLLAGITLFLVRPYQPGERVRLTAARGGTVEAEIVRIGLWNTTLCTPSGLLVVANTRLLQR